MKLQGPRAPRPLVSEIALDKSISIDAERVSRALSVRIAALGRATDWRGDDASLAYASDDGNISIRLSTEVIASERLENALADAARWWTESALIRNHTAVVTVTAASDTMPAIELAHLHVQATAALVDVASAVGATTFGVFWNGERLYPAEFVQAHATTNPALGLPVGFHVATPGFATSIYTSGLPALGLKNIEAESTDDPAVSAPMVQNMALYLITNGDVIHDGDTVGYSRTQKIRVRETDATWGGERVLRLSLTSV
ncbi:hypothetical protein BH09GEM1_BH09GEM1_46640 [soil metagenome]